MGNLQNKKLVPGEAEPGLWLKKLYICIIYSIPQQTQEWHPPSYRRLMNRWTLGCPWESGNRKFNWKVYWIELTKDVCEVQEEAQMLEVWIMKAPGRTILYSLSMYILDLVFADLFLMINSTHKPWKCKL